MVTTRRGRPRKDAPPPVTTAEPTPHAKRTRAEIPLFEQRFFVQGAVISNNAKTGGSINLPIHGTCEPSAVCQRVCYACTGWFVKQAVQEHALAVYQWFLRTPPHVCAWRLADECDGKGLKYLRWNGSGDLIPETVATINALAVLRPDITQVIYSRKPAMINALSVHPSIVVNLSLDRSSLAIADQVVRPEVRGTYLRETDDDIPPVYCGHYKIEVVFPVVRRGKHLPVREARDCPADAGRIPVAGACVSCLRCFKRPSETEPIYARAAEKRG